MKDTDSELKAFEKKLARDNGSFLGYPCNPNYDYSKIVGFFKYSLNNVGDPFINSNFKINSKNFEREVLYFFAKLYKISLKTFWGYVTHGGTEGNMYGLFIAREKFPDGLLYFSGDSHYSLPKIAKLLRMKPMKIPSLKNGEISYDELETAIKKNKDKPVIINANIGTTMKGAIDNVETILEIIKRNGVKKYYIHCDAALFGMILPFIAHAPQINFTKGIDSIAISGHKFIGTPIPCGIVLTKKKYVERLKEEVEYVGSLDTTIPGSRNGHTSLLLWYTIKVKGKRGFKKDAKDCLENANHIFLRLQEMDYPCYLNPFSNTVVFKKPSEQLMKKWQLASQKSWAHIVVMQHVTKEKIDAFLKDLHKEVSG